MLYINTHIHVRKAMVYERSGVEMENQTCRDWLREILTDGEYCLCDWVREEARKKGFTRAELKDARNYLGVKTFHQFDEDGATPNWFWYLEENG